MNLIGRTQALFDQDIDIYGGELSKIVSQSRFLVLGGAGSIGQAVTKEIFKRNPRKLHVVDISENNLVELVRDLRSSCGYIDGEFQTLVLDIGSLEYDAFFRQAGGYDYILNLSALKHVRSERDPFTLMRLIDVNIFNTEKTLKQAIVSDVKKYFCVSTDKAANPVNMMGASKRIMELFLMRRSLEIDISTARFANVAFSDGSLLHGFNRRIEKKQPLVAPKDVKRYFVTPEESGLLCLLSCIFGENCDIFFPKLKEDLHLRRFDEIALRFLEEKGLQPVICESEEEARLMIDAQHKGNKWPCFFSDSDTTGEKPVEEFFTNNEKINFNHFPNIGIVKNAPAFNQDALNSFEKEIRKLRSGEIWAKQEIVDLFQTMLPNFVHIEKGKNLDGKM